MKSHLLAIFALLSLGACSGAGSATPGAAPPDGTNPPGPNDDAGTTSDGAAPQTDGSTTPPPSSVPSSGCGLANVATGLQSKMMTVGGASRHYQLLVPTAYDAKTPTRLVFVFHGLGGDGDQIRAYFSFETEAAGQALFVYPDGLPQAVAGGATAWAEDDLTFFDKMVTDISATHCVDSKRIFAAGHSYGAYMSNLVGCERGDVVRAIAPVSGGLIAGTCKGPLAVWLAHGNNDLTVAQSEGTAARDHWVTANGCAATTKPTTPSPCVTYDGCSANHPVTWCSFAGGHYPLPAFTQQAIWSFFKAL